MTTSARMLVFPPLTGDEAARALELLASIDRVLPLARRELALTRAHYREVGRLLTVAKLEVEDLERMRADVAARVKSVEKVRG